MVTFQIGDMPKTDRDATTILCELSIRYAWIDSLGIIQDDSRDQDRELQKWLRFTKMRRVPFMPHGTRTEIRVIFMMVNRPCVLKFENRIARENTPRDRHTAFITPIKKVETTG